MASCFLARQDLNFMLWSLPEFEVFSHIMGPDLNRAISVGKDFCCPRSTYIEGCWLWDVWTTKKRRKAIFWLFCVSKTLCESIGMDTKYCLSKGLDEAPPLSWYTLEIGQFRMLRCRFTLCHWHFWLRSQRWNRARPVNSADYLARNWVRLFNVLSVLLRRGWFMESPHTLGFFDDRLRAIRNRTIYGLDHWPSRGDRLWPASAVEVAAEVWKLAHRVGFKQLGLSPCQE